MPTERAPRETERVTGPDARWYLPVLACRKGDYRDALGGALKFLEAYSYLWDPAVEVRFVTAWSGEELAIGFEVTADDTERARRACEDLGSAATGSQHRLTVGEPTTTPLWAAAGSIAYEFVPHEAPDGIISERSLLFGPSVVSTDPFQVVVELLAPTDPTSRPVPTARMPWMPSDPTPEGETRNLATVALRGGADSARAIAALLAADSAEDGFLMPVQTQPGAHLTPRLMPPRLLGHLLALPSRVGDMLPERAPSRESGLFEAIDATPTPHVQFLGASGQGKTTGLIALGTRSLWAGRAVVAIDVHDGHLARSLYHQAVKAGRRALYIDLNPEQDLPTPTLPLWQRPEGVSVERHIDEQFDILRNNAWAGSDPDWWGPAGTRCTRGGLALVSKDPEHKFGLSRMPQLVDPDEREFRGETLARVGDPDLTRLVMREIMPMMTKRDADNAMVWVLGKFEPFASPQVAAILEGTSSRIPIDEAMTRGYSLFVHVPIGLLGAIPGKMIAGLILHRAFSALVRGGQPKPVDFIEDEFHLYASSLTARMLAESRKFGVRLILANQNLAQLPRDLRDTVLGNTGSIACYRLNPADANLMDGLFPTIPVRVLQTLRPHTIALTTFAEDMVVAGPEPLPAPGDEPPSWGYQLGEFWDGEEPDLTPKPRPDKDPVRGRPMSRAQRSFIDELLGSRGMPAGS